MRPVVTVNRVCSLAVFRPEGTAGISPGLQPGESSRIIVPSPEGATQFCVAPSGLRAFRFVSIPGLKPGAIILRRSAAVSQVIPNFDANGLTRCYDTSPLPKEIP